MDFLHAFFKKEDKEISAKETSSDYSSTAIEEESTFKKNVESIGEKKILKTILKETKNEKELLEDGQQQL